MNPFRDPTDVVEVKIPTRVPLTEAEVTGRTIQRVMLMLCALGAFSAWRGCDPEGVSRQRGYDEGRAQGITFCYGEVLKMKEPK